LEAQSTSTHQILLKSDDFRLRYSDKTIFKMAVVRVSILQGFKVSIFPIGN